jgi:flagellin-like protein
MKLKQLFTDEQAVSPVIGVILMVAITVILAAVIGTFVLGLGDQVSNSPPQATLSFNYDTANTEVNVTHSGGETLDGANLELTGSQSGSVNDTDFGSASVGDLLYINDGYAPGETLRVVWNNPNGGSANTISQSDAPA